MYAFIRFVFCVVLITNANYINIYLIFLGIFRAYTVFLNLKT
jgi:hypothetical protein